MDTRRLGPDGPHVSCIGLGQMPLSIQGRPDETQALRVIHAALDLGVTFVDTADSYCLDERDKHHGEVLTAKALATWSGDCDSIVVATKGGLLRPGGDWTVDATPAQLREACERSLRALHTDCIDLYQLHAPDPKVPLADSVGEIARLREEGKVRLVGLSNVTAEHVTEALGIVPVATVQNRLNCLDRQPLDGGVVDACTQEGLAFLAHSPVGGHHGHVRLASEATLGAVAERRGASRHEVALAWLLALAPEVIPIPGASRVESIGSSVRAAELELSEEDRADLRTAFGK